MNDSTTPPAELPKPASDTHESGLSGTCPSDCSAPHPADYVDGMAPRTDALERSFAGKGPHYRQYHLMLAHARALEIELREAQNAEGHVQGKPDPQKEV